MKTKLTLGLVAFALAVFFPLRSISSSTPPKSDTVVISSSNLIVLNSEINGESTAAVITKARELDASLGGLKEKVSGKKHIFLFLSSPGGSIQSGMEMNEVLKGLGRPVDTITSIAASMAFQLAQGLDERLILKSGLLMSHHAAGEFGGSFGGVPTQLDSRYQFWLDRIREMDEQTVARTNGKQTYDSYTKQYDHELWLTGKRAVEQGYADRVVVVKCDSSLNGVTNHHVNFLGLDISYDIDNCPLNSSIMNIKVSAPDGKTLSQEMTNEVITKFSTQYENKQKKALPFSW